MEIKTTNYGVCKVKKHKYQTNGNLALSLVDETGQPVVYITTNIFPMGEDEFCANYFNMGATLWNDIVSSCLQASQRTSINFTLKMNHKKNSCDSS